MPVLNSPYNYYLNTVLGQWPTNLALASQWYLTFDFSGVGALTSQFQNLLNNQEYRSNWQYNPSVTSTLLDPKLQRSGENLMGCAWARQVRLPSESIDTSHTGLDYGGYQAPATSNTRKNYENLQITMLETNASFIDLILRPWVVAVGYYGLVARDPASPKNVKCNALSVTMMSKTGYGNMMQPRKVYNFYNVAPVNIPTEEYSYMEEGLRTSPIDFVYDYYSVSDAETGNLVALT
jgi:hypothetical protein